DYLRDAVAVAIAGRHINAVAQGRIVGEEADQCDARGGEGSHLGPATHAGASDDLGLAVTVDVAAGHGHAAAEVRIVGEEVGDGGEAAAADFEGSHSRPAANGGAGDDFGRAVPGQVRGGDVDSAPERRLIGEEVRDDLQIEAVEDSHT